MCGSSKIGYCLGNLIYIFEKLASCCALTAVVTCLMTTVLLMLGFGIGLGYNYCFVDLKTKQADEERDMRHTFTTTMGTTPLITNSEEKAPQITNKGMTTTQSITPQSTTFDISYEYYDEMTTKHRIIPSFRRKDLLMRRLSDGRRTEGPVVVKRTMILPLHAVDFPSLLSRIRTLNKNVTLELIAA